MGTKYKNIYQDICTFENIWLASRKARVGKRYKNEVASFEYDLEKNIFEIQEQLLNESYSFGKYREFKVFEPKERLICAAPYKDRVVHHAICNIIEPILDKAMIYDSYACRNGKGTHKAVIKAKHFLKSSSWCFKFDIQKYFFTIDHEILFRILSKKITDTKVLSLVSNILSTYQSPEEYYYFFKGDNLFDSVRSRGLPIGNLTSQLFANYYLNPLDRFIKEDLKVTKYIRYMDDAIIFESDKKKLISFQKEIVRFAESFRLRLHPLKSQIFPAKNGIQFLGFHIYQFYIRILRANLQRFKKRLLLQIKLFSKDSISFKSLCQSLSSWLGYADSEKNKRFINEILECKKFKNSEKEFSFFIP